MLYRYTILTLLCTLISLPSYAQDKEWIGMAYYDTECIYDTIESQFYNDKVYTPSGKYRWDTQRYHQKINHTAQVIDSLRMPIVAVWGVENEQVVKDLTATVEGDYAYIHRTMDFTLGLDFALLYYGDVFFPEKITTHYNALCIEGKIGNNDIAIILNNNSSSIGVLIKELELSAEQRSIILIGRQSATTGQQWGLRDVMDRAERQGRGTEIYYDRWKMRHRIATNIDSVGACDVYIKEWLLDADGAPKPTYFKGKYHGGYSTSLPIYIYFDKMLDFSVKKL